MRPRRRALLFSVGVCLFALGGCRDAPPPGSPLDPNYRPPPSNASQAAAFSGGKITRFMPAIDANPANPVDREMLKACRQINLGRHTAQGAYDVVFWHKQKTLMKALIVGNDILIDVGEATRDMVLDIGGWVRHGHNNILANTRAGQMIIYPNDRQFPQQYIMLTPNSPFADVGGTKIRLQQPVVWVEPEKVQVMLLSDWLKLFQASDAQTRGHSIRQVGLIYKLPPYGHF